MDYDTKNDYEILVYCVLKNKLSDNKDFILTSHKAVGCDGRDGVRVDLSLEVKSARVLPIVLSSLLRKQMVNAN